MIGLNGLYLENKKFNYKNIVNKKVKRDMAIFYNSNIVQNHKIHIKTIKNKLYNKFYYNYFKIKKLYETIDIYLITFI